MRKVESGKELWKLVKSKGVLVERKRLIPGDSFLSDQPKLEYKRSLGAVSVYDFFRRGKIKSIYVVYEDHDGSIKYYDYIQYNPSTFSFYIVPLLILLMTFIGMIAIEMFIGFNSVITFAIFFISINLLFNASYAFFVIRKNKKMRVKNLLRK